MSSHLGQPVIPRKRSVVAGTAGLAAVLTTVLAVYEFYERHPKVDMAGEWQIEHRIQQSTYRPFQGMTLSYRLFLRQDGKHIQGSGEKYLENGAAIPSTAHTPIEVNGTVSGDEVRGTFVEHGYRRTSSGTFVWRLTNDRHSLQGRFTSTAASVSGNLNGVRVE